MGTMSGEIIYSLFFFFFDAFQFKPGADDFGSFNSCSVH